MNTGTSGIDSLQFSQSIGQTDGSNSLSINALSSIMTSAIDAADKKVRDLLQTLDDNNAKIDDGNQIVNSNELTTELNQLSSGAITLSSLNQNSYIAQMVNFYNINIAPSGGVISDTAVLDADTLRNIINASFAPTLSGMAAKANSIISAVIAAGIPSSSSSASSSQNIAIMQLVNFYNANILQRPSDINIIGGTGFISNRDSLSNDQVAKIQGAVQLFSDTLTAGDLLSKSGSLFSADGMQLNLSALDPNNSLILRAINNYNKNAIYKIPTSGLVSLSTLVNNLPALDPSLRDIFNQMHIGNPMAECIPISELKNSAAVLNLFSLSNMSTISFDQYPVNINTLVSSQDILWAVKKLSNSPQTLSMNGTSTFYYGILNKGIALLFSDNSSAAAEIKNLTMNKTISEEILDSNSSIKQLIDYYNNHVADQSKLDLSNTNVSDRINKGETITDSSAFMAADIQAIQKKVQTYIDSLGASSQQFYLDVQQAMNQYTLQIQAWTQILQVFAKSLDDPLQRL